MSNDEDSSCGRDRRHKESVLGELGLSLVEYEAMICPHYEIPLPPKEMARYTTSLQQACSDGECAAHSADEYLAAIEGMIRKGWLCLHDGRRMRTDDDVPSRKVWPTPRGAVVFSKKGFHLHRRAVASLHGRACLNKMDSFSLVDRKARTVTFYARTAVLCREWAHGAQQKTRCELTSLLDAPAEVTGVFGPARIGRWRPWPFLTHRSGYRTVVTYRRLRRRRIRVAERQAEGMIESFAPLFIWGTIAGKQFTFGDHVGWRSPSREDKDAVFDWSFTVTEMPQTHEPLHAQLSADDPAARKTAVPMVEFELKEPPHEERCQMLSVEQGKEVLEYCAKRYLASRERG